jgi:hypothetical protein
MDDQLNQAADELVTLTPDEKIKLAPRIARLEGAVDALLVLAPRPYFSSTQVALILAEADELDDKDLAPLQAALRDAPMSEILQATVDELGDDDGTVAR